MNSVPTQIGPYTITREIGRGGMGVVYLALDIKRNRDIAIKALRVEVPEDQAPKQAGNKTRYFLSSFAARNNSLLKFCEIAVGMRGL